MFSRGIYTYARFHELVAFPLVSQDDDADCRALSPGLDARACRSIREKKKANPWQPLVYPPTLVDPQFSLKLTSTVSSFFKRLLDQFSFPSQTVVMLSFLCFQKPPRFSAEWVHRDHARSSRHHIPTETSPCSNYFDKPPKNDKRNASWILRVVTRSL